FNALPGLMERFSIGVVYVPPTMFDQPGIPLQALRERLESRRIPIRALMAGNRLAAGSGVDIEVWHPTRLDLTRSDNANSLVLAIEYAGVGMLLTADIESPGLEDLLAEHSRQWQIVTAPHHGGGLEQQEAFADWARPEWVIFSGADPSKVKPAEAAYLARDVRSLHTARDGAVRVEIQPDGLTISHWQGTWKML
ncbi:MAG: hypothetical protein MUF25_14990, partial [Pirellulaceae bacterium]|nr:hypothetical protein [Pirellulaceae bacterium]